MPKKLQKKHKEMIQKQEILDHAKHCLKTEFVGIDSVIDQVVNSIGSWFLFPDMQERPVVVNLWGLTGVGKSSLVARLAELLDFNKKFYPFDLGENERKDWSIKSQLGKIYERQNGYPVIIAMDEFQHARTIDQHGVEVEKSSNRIVWQLLDSGKFYVTQHSDRVDELYELLYKLKFLLKNGINVKKGEVISGLELFNKNMEDISYFKSLTNDDDDDNNLFIPSTYHDDIFTLASKQFDSVYEVKEQLQKLNGQRSIKFIQEIIKIGNSPKQVDCSKSLIFVLGNLDEAYTMSNNYSPDISADDFHEESQNITVPTIKRALQNRFRNEQIARLGNTHIIYPAFSKASFEQIIMLELEKISNKVFDKEQVKLNFDDSILKLIYREGVYPTQGCRPIFTTIYQIIQSKMGQVITELYLNKINASDIWFSTDNRSLLITYKTKMKVLHTLNIEITLSLEELRKDTKDDVQTIIAVHEAGHAVISTILLKVLPETIQSKTTGDENGGFVRTKLKWEYISRKEILIRVAFLLGGLAAEKIVFGHDYVTTGAEDDINKATKFVSSMIKECGMGTLPVAYQVEDHRTNLYANDAEGKLSHLVESWIELAMKLAEQTLIEQKALLLYLADYLSDHTQMNKDQIKQVVQNHAVNFNIDSLMENSDLRYYRNKLKSDLIELDNLTITENVKEIRSVGGMA